MATKFTDIKDLLRKTDNEEASEEIESAGISQDEYLTAEEFTKEIITPIIELQNDAKKAVKTVKFNNVSYEPDENGVVEFNQMMESDSYTIKLTSPTKADRNIKAGDSLVIALRYMALKITTAGDRNNYRDVAGTLTLSTRKEGETEWVDKYTQANLVSQSENYDADDANSYNTSIDVSSYLVVGVQDVRIRVASSYADENNVTHEFHGDLTFNVNVVNLKVKNLQDWSKRVLADDGFFPFSFSVMGAVDRELHVEMTGSLGTWATTKSFLASDQRSEANPYTWSQPEIAAYGLLAHGVHTVTAWLTCSDGMGGTLTSDKEVCRFMVVNKSATAEQLTKPYLMLQGVQTEVENYVRTVISSYAVWQAKSAEEPETAATDAIPVSIRITNAGDGDFDYSAAYYVSESKATVGVQYDIDTTIEIENSSSGEAPSSYQAYLRIFRYEGEELVNFMKESIGSRFIVFTVDNSNDYSPVTGAHFYLDPKVRNNTEDNWESIINKQTQETVPSTWVGFDGNSDGWVTDDDGVKVLRVPAGRELTIGYEPFEAFLTNPSAAMSLEMEFAVRNITAEDDPVINISQTIASTLETLGLVIKPLTGAIWAQENQTEDDQDFGFQEDNRVHLVLTLTPALVAKGSDEFTWQSTGSSTPTNRPTAKIYINGKPQRAVQYDIKSSGVWIRGEGHGGIRLGNPNCDVDIYTIRCYRGTTLTAQNAIQNFTATRPSAETKNLIRSRNDILDGNGRVSRAKVRAKGKRCLTLVGEDNYKINQSKEIPKPCYWIIDYYDDNGVYVPELSGTLGKASYEAFLAGKCKYDECCGNTAQGSTANTYWWNNEQTKLGNITYVTRVKFNTLHSDFGWKPSMSNFTEGEAAENPLWLGDTQIQGDEVAGLSEAQKEKLEIDVIDGWVDGNGMFRGNFYTPSIGAAKAQKLVNKINYASPMQSHKQGATDFFNDIMKKVCEDDLPTWMKNNDAPRFAVQEHEFFFFNQPYGYDEPIFIGFSTFGSGKCDKPTWGYNKKQMFGFEGLNNNLPLCDFRVPADDDVVYSSEKEAWMYNGTASFEYSIGDTKKKKNPDGTTMTNSDGSTAKFPTDDNDKYFRKYVNFIYTHDPRIDYFNGTRSEFDAYFTKVMEAATSEGATEEATALLDTMQTTKWWMRDGDEAFHLLRYNFVQNKFVDAGTWDATNWYQPGVRNLATDSVTSAAYEAWKASTDFGDYAALNERFRMAIAKSFNDNCEKVLHKKNHMTHYNVINFLLAGTDNCSKNTYFIYDIAEGKTWLYQDDMDTIMKTDNNGRQTKVYFLSRYFDVADTKAGLKKQKDYEGTASALFNIMEAAWEDLDPTALPGNMQQVLTAMGSLVGDNEEIDGLKPAQRKTPLGCLHKYFFRVQKYFPEIAWAEQQRIRYDWPASWGYSSYGNQARSVLAVTQGVGDQTESEMQYMERRLAMICSYAAWGEFAGVDGTSGLADASTGLSLTPGKGRIGSDYTFQLVPHQFIYPCATQDRTTINPHIRLKPGESYTFKTVSASNPISGDSSVALAAINYYRSIGNLGNMTIGNNKLEVKGRRMTEFVAEPTEGSTAFAPGQVIVDASSLQRLSLKGASTQSGTLDTSAATRLQSLDLRGTKYGKVIMPKSPQLATIRLGDSLTQLEMQDMLALKTLSLDGYSKLETVALLNCSVDAKPLAVGCQSANAPLTYFRVNNISWTDVAPAVLTYLTGIKSVSLTGTIAVTSGQNVDSALKQALLIKFGDVDSAGNSLYVTYTIRQVSSLAITSQKFVIAEAGDYQYECQITPTTANNFSSVSWEITDNDLGVTVDPLTGMLHAPNVGEEANNPTATLTVTATLTNGSKVSASVELKLFNRIPKVGDFAYSNGEFDSVLYPGKTVVGWVYKVTPYASLNSALLEEYLSDERIKAQYDGGRTMYEVLVESTGELKISTTDEANSIDSFAWGIYPDTSGNNGFTETERQVVADAMGIPLADLTDLTALSNCTQSGLKNEDGTSTTYNYIRDFNAYDDTTADGFPAFTGNVAANRWNGKIETRSIVQHAKNIIEQYVAQELADSSGNNIYAYLPQGRDHVIPANDSELADLCIALSNLGGNVRWRQLCYPAAYSCALYEPQSGGKAIDGLSEWFAQGEWYMPAAGDNMRLYTFFRNSRGLIPTDSGTPTAEFSDEDNENREMENTDARRPWYANLIKRSAVVGRSCPVANPVQTYRWCTTEYYSNTSWSTYFYDGYFYINLKYIQFKVRPVAAFPFAL